MNNKFSAVHGGTLQIHSLPTENQFRALQKQGNFVNPYLSSDHSTIFSSRAWVVTGTCILEYTESVAVSVASVAHTAVAVAVGDIETFRIGWAVLGAVAAVQC